MFAFDPIQKVANILHNKIFSRKQDSFWKQVVKIFTHNMFLSWQRKERVWFGF